MNDRVRRVQELRRSNAARPRPGKRWFEYCWNKDDETDNCPCPCHSGPDHCAICDNDYSDLCTPVAVRGDIVC